MSRPIASTPNLPWQQQQRRNRDTAAPPSTPSPVPAFALHTTPDDDSPVERGLGSITVRRMTPGSVTKHPGVPNVLHMRLP